MINTSIEFQQAHLENSACITKASILLKDGTLLEIDNSQISQGATKIDDGVTGSNKFTIGSAISNKLTLSLNNRYDAFSDYDFTDAVVTVWVGKQLSDRIEWLKKGVYNTDDPTATPAILSLECLDNMSKFDTTYDGGIGFPASLQSIVQYCCTQCGVLLLNGEFPNFSYQVSKNPFTDATNITYRAIIAYCALLAGCYARCNADGRLEFKWYDTAAFDDVIDGGIFDETTEASYQTGADLDGGNFTDYSSGDSADGGTFTDNMPYHHIYSFSSLSVSTEDVVITGIRVTATDSEDAAGKKVEGETYLCGAEGYVLDVSGNPLVEAGKAKEVAEYLAGRVVGMRFRPFQASAIGDPSWEAGDAVIVTDRKGNSYHTYLTNITYSTGGYASISCDAEPAARHSADRYAEINKVIADIKKDSQQKLTEYGKLLEQMNSLAINAMGYYETSVKQDDGSDITYMHDKPVLAESKIVYKKSIDGVFWTNDYQGTDQATTAAGKWKSGIDKDGNAVLNVIAAIGISFDWAHGGTLTLGGKDNGNGVLKIYNGVGTEIGTWDNTGIHLYQGEIKGPVIKVGGASNKYGSLDVLGTNDVLRMRAANNTLRFYDEEGAEVGAITCDNLMSMAGSFKHSITLGLKDLSADMVFTDDGRINTYAKFIDMAKSKVQFRGDSGFGVYVYAAAQSTAAWDARLVEASDGYYGNYNFKLYRGTSSSKRYKEIGKEMTAEDVEQLYNIAPVWAKYKKGYLEEGDERCGVEHPMFIAENVAEYAPLAVDHNKDGEIENWNYRVMIPYMFQMLKEQKKELEDLRLRLEEKHGN